jgi:hypothetical protein
MKISLQLKKGDLNKAGFAPIQLTVSWAGLRVREATGELTRPEWWDKDAQQVRNVKGSYSGNINDRLHTLTNAVERADQAASDRREQLTEEQVRQLIRQTRDPAKYAPAPAPVPEPSPAEQLATKSVPELFQGWMAEQSAKISKKTGRPRARTTLSNLNGTYEKLREFEATRGEPLALATMDLQRFYHPFWEWFTKDLGQSINTFGKHIVRLRSFLEWCEDQDLPVSRQYKKFEAPSLYVGVEALTEQELLAIAALDFRSEALRRKLYYGYSAKQGGTIDSPEVVAYLAEVELARDKFLQCAYSALHISDADRARRTDITHVPGIADRVLKINRGKNLNPCYVPFFDDGVFKLVALSDKYAGQSEHLVPPCPTVNRHLKTIARLVDLTRLTLSTKIGRKTFCTIKIMRGTPTRLVMMATGHTTEASFNHYLGVDLVKLLEQYRKYEIAPAA